MISTFKQQQEEQEQDQQIQHKCTTIGSKSTVKWNIVDILFPFINVIRMRNEFSSAK